MNNEKIVVIERSELFQYNNVLDTPMEDQTIEKEQVWDGWEVKFDDGVECFLDICTDVDDNDYPYVCMKLQMNGKVVAVGDCEDFIEGEHFLEYNGNKYYIKVEVCD